MASIRKRTWTNRTGTHEAWVITYTDERGQRKSGGQFERKKDADAKLRQIQDELERGVHVPKSEALTFGEVAEDWLARDVRRRNRIQDEMGGGRVAHIEKVLKHHLLPPFGKIRINKFADHELVQEWLNGDGTRLGKLEEISPRTGRRLSVKYIEGFLQVHRQILSWAVKQKLGLKLNPYNDGWPRLPKREATEIPFLDANQAILLLKWITAPRRAGVEKVNVYLSQRLAVLIALFAGLRCGEVCALDWPSINLESWEIDVRQSLSKHDGLKEPKTRHGRRRVPMNAFLHAALAAHWDRCGQPQLGPVLLNQYGTRMQPDILGTYHWPLIAKTAGVVDRDGHHFCTFHGLRHTAGSLWLADGMPLEEVSDRLGHASVDFTRNTYMHRMPHDRRALRAITNIENRFAQLGMNEGLELQVSHRPLELAPPPTIDVTPTEVVTSTTNRHAIDTVAGEPMLDWQRKAIELYSRNDITIHEIARQVRKDNRKTAKFLERAGLYTPPKKPAWGGWEEYRDQAVAMAQEQTEDGFAKYSIVYIADTLGVGATSVQRWIEDAGIDRLRAQSGGAHPKATRMKALAMYRAKKSVAEICAACGIGSSTAKRWIEREERDRPIREHVLAMWRANEPADKIAAELDIADVTVARIAAEAGLASRGRGWKSRPLSDQPEVIRQRERQRLARARKRVVSELDAAPVQHDPL